MAEIDLTAVSGVAQRLRGNVETVLRGKRDVVRQAVVCLLAEGHLLIEDVPGTGKTTLARALAQSVGAEWKRIQFTPDLLPGDVTGVDVFHQDTQSFVFHPGPIFTSFVIADEVNRASPKTQSALLEVMEERRVTVDGTARPVGSPFLVLATQNPVEMDGTYRLPEAQLDRFLMRLTVGYPDVAAEADLLTRRTHADPLDALPTVVNVAELRDAIAAVDQVVAITPALARYIAELAATSRSHPHLRLGASPRGSLALLRAARANAAVDGRPYVTAEDVHQVAEPVLAHRLLLTPDAELRGVSAPEVVAAVLAATPAPTDAAGVLR